MLVSIVSSEISPKKPYRYFVVIKERRFAFGIIAVGDSCTGVLEESIQMTALEEMS